PPSRSATRRGPISRTTTTCASASCRRAPGEPARPRGGAARGAGGAGAGARAAARRRSPDAAAERAQRDRAPERRGARGGRVAADPDGHALGEARDRRALELRPRGDGEGHGPAQRLRPGGGGGRVGRQAQRLRRGGLLGDPRLGAVALLARAARAHRRAGARAEAGARGGRPRARLPALAPPVVVARRSVIEQAAQQTQILVGGLAPPLDHPDHAAVKVLSSVLGGGMAGRLFVELRDKRALAYTATALYEPVKEPGVLVLYLGTTPETAAQAEQALLAEVGRV